MNRSKYNIEKRNTEKKLREIHKVKRILSRYDDKIMVLIRTASKTPKTKTDDWNDLIKDYNKTVKALYRELIKADFEKNQTDKQDVINYFMRLSSISPFPRVILKNK